MRMEDLPIHFHPEKSQLVLQSSVLFLAFFLQPRGEERQVPTTEGRSAAPGRSPPCFWHGTSKGSELHTQMLNV